MLATTRLRAAVLGACVLILLAIFLGVVLTDPYSQLRITSLTQGFGLTAALYLYLALLITPLSQILPPRVRGTLSVLRRPLGVSAFVAALLHASIGFWGELGGFSGLPFIGHSYLKAILFSFTALLILLLLAVTSTDWAVRRLGGARWKWLHRLVYLAGLLVILHVLLIGGDFGSTQNPTFRLAFVLFAFLMILEALRVDRYLQRTYFRPIGLGFVSVMTATALMWGLLSFSGAAGLSVHAGHDEAAAAATPAHVHFHANFLVYINGQPVSFNADKYMEPTSICAISTDQTEVERVHMHDNDGGLIHVHSANVTWGDFFSYLGYAVNDSAIVTDTGAVYAADGTHTLQFILNGQRVSDISNTYIKSEDRLLVDYGTDTDAQVQAHYVQVPSNAAYANSHTDPATCSGS